MGIYIPGHSLLRPGRVISPAKLSVVRYRTDYRPVNDDSHSTGGIGRGHDVARVQVGMCEDDLGVV